MNRQQLFTLLKSLGKAAIVAAILAVAVAGFQSRFWIWFGAFFVSQFVLFFIILFVVGRFVDARAKKNTITAQQVEIANALSNQSLTLDCAYCGTPNIVPIMLSEENIFKCFQCFQENVVYMKFFAARRTNPVALKVDTENRLET